MNNARCQVLDQPLSLVEKAPEGFVRKLQRTAVAISDAILSWQERAATRAHLASLDDHMLRDLGLSRADVEHESSIPFWRRS